MLVAGLCYLLPTWRAPASTYAAPPLALRWLMLVVCLWVVCCVVAPAYGG